MQNINQRIQIYLPLFIIVGKYLFNFDRPQDHFFLGKKVLRSLLLLSLLLFHHPYSFYVFFHNFFHSSQVMEACLWGFYGGWNFELQRGPLMVIFHHGDAAEDKGEEVRKGTIH